MIDAATLIELFDREFLATENTRLEGGGEEPVYLPADARCANHRIVFRHDYAASALHEVAHWCIAGSARRKLHDYGYWYAPDGRVAKMVRMPVQQVTSLTFGGADLRTLFVTSASLRLTPAARERQPLAGHVFAFQANAAGLPEPLFEG